MDKSRDKIPPAKPIDQSKPAGPQPLTSGQPDQQPRQPGPNDPPGQAAHLPIDPHGNPPEVKAPEIGDSGSPETQRDVTEDDPQKKAAKEREQRERERHERDAKI